METDPLARQFKGPAPAGAAPADPLARTFGRKAAPAPRDPALDRTLARQREAFVAPEEQDKALDSAWWGEFGKQAKTNLLTAQDPIVKTLTGAARGFGDWDEVYKTLQTRAANGDQEAAGRLKAMEEQRTDPLKTGVEAGLGALEVAGAGVGNLGKGAALIAGGQKAAALSAPIATTILSGLQAVPGGHKVLEAVPGAFKAGARALGATPGGKVEGAAGVAGALTPALAAAWFGKTASPQILKTIASEAGQIGIMGGTSNIPQAVGVDPSSGAGMALGLAGTIAGQAGAGKVERGIVERQAAKGRAIETLKAIRSHEEPMTPTPEQTRAAYEGEKAGMERASDLEAAARPPVETAPDPLAEGVEGPPKPPDELAEAAQEARADAQKAAEYRKELDPYRAKVEAAQAAKDRAAAEAWSRGAAFDEAAEAWDSKTPAERGALIEKIPPGIVKTGDALRPFDRLGVDQQEHIQAVLKDPSAFADAMPEEVAPGQPKGKAVPPAGEVPPPVPPPPAETSAAPVPDAAPGKSVQDIAPAKPSPFLESKVNRAPDKFAKPDIEGTSPSEDIGIQSMLIVNPKIGPGDVARVLRDMHSTPDAVVGPNHPLVKKVWDDLILAGKIDPEGNSLVHAEIARMRAEKQARDDAFRKEHIYDPETQTWKPIPYPSSLPAPTAGEPVTGPVPTVPAARGAHGEVPAPQPPKELPAAQPETGVKNVPWQERFPPAQTPEEVVRTWDTAQLEDLAGSKWKEVTGSKEELPMVAAARAELKRRGVGPVIDTTKVEKAPQIETKPPEKPKGGTYLGSGLGGLQKSYESLTPEQRRVFDRVLKTTLGAAGGYGVGALTDDRLFDDPDKRTAYRFLMAALGAYSGMGAPYWKEAWNYAAKKAGKVPGAKAFVNPREAISPQGAEVIRAKDRGASLAAIDASVIAHGLPKVPDEILYPYLGGERGSERAYREHLASLGPDAAAAADEAVEAAKQVIRHLSEERAALGGIAPETHAERYAGADDAKVLEAGFLNRILIDRFAEGARPAFFGAKANRPKLWQESVRQDGHGAIVAIPAETVKEILQEAGIENPWMTRHGTVLQKGQNTLVKWAPTPEGAASRDAFLTALKDYARQQAEVMVGPGKTGGVGHLAQRLKDAPGLRVALSRPQVKKMLGEYGIPMPESIEQSGSRQAVRWPDTPDGQAATDAFEVALRDYAQAESTVRLGEGASGGTGHLVMRTFDPLPMEVRKALGEVGFQKGGARAQTFITATRLGQQVANLKMYEGVAAGRDAKGDWTVPLPEKLPEPVKDPISGQNIHLIEGADGNQYVAIPASERPAYGALAGKAVRKDWWDYLSVSKRIADASETWFQQFIGRWRAGKTQTTRGAMRNFLGNLYFSHLAKTAPYFADSLQHYIRVGRDFLDAVTSGNLAPLRKYVDRFGIEVYPEDLTGDPNANATIRAVRDAAIDSTKLRAGASGRMAGDIVTGGSLTEGIGKVPGPVVAGALGATANVAYGKFVKHEEGDDLLKRAAVGGAAGAGLNYAYKRGIGIPGTGRRIPALADVYGLTDAYFKAVAGETLVRRGMSIPEARRIVRGRFQNFSEMTPVEEMISGRKTGAWQYVGLISNPFARFYTQLVRTTTNTMREDPAAAVTGVLLAPILIELIEKGAGVFGPGQEEERRAAHNLSPSAIHYRGEGGKLEKMDIGPILPWSDMAEDVRGLASNDSTMEKSARDLFSLTLGGGPIMGTGRSAYILSEGPELKDLRSGFPIGEPGESAGDAFTRTLMQTWFHPSTPGAGTDWKRAEEQVTETVKKGSRKQPLEPGRTALALGLGLNTGDVDFQKVLRSLQIQRDREIDAAERKFDRAYNDQQFRSNPDRVRRQREIYRAEIQAARQRFTDARARLTPQGAPK